MDGQVIGEELTALRFGRVILLFAMCVRFENVIILFILFNVFVNGFVLQSRLI